MIKIRNRSGSSDSWSADLYEGEELLFRLSVTDNRRQFSISELFPEDPERPHFAFIRVTIPLSDEQIMRWALNVLETLYWRSSVSWIERRRFRLPRL